MKENVICGHLIPAGTGQREFEKIVVGSREDYERMMSSRRSIIDFSEPEM
jgi:DNA-directed RNA polymerase subunit beta'